MESVHFYFIFLEKFLSALCLSQNVIIYGVENIHTIPKKQKYMNFIDEEGRHKCVRIYVRLLQKQIRIPDLTINK